MKGHLLMSEKERRRKAVFDMVALGAWTLVEATEHLGLSYRQCRRSYQRYRQEGDAGLVHRSRGRRSNRQTDPGVREAILHRYDEVYEGFGQTLAAEKLGGEGYGVHHETLRRWLLAEGKWQRKRKHSPYRSRRERRAQFGALVQMDGSLHHWFGQDHPQSCLIEMIDDATSIRLALMAKEETTEACMRLLWQWVERYGIPRALYTDKKNVFIIRARPSRYEFITDRPATLEEQLAGEEPRTAFGKACAKLDITIIPANSPQAKGRVERAHGVQQDRLVKSQRALALR
ncbi:MAG TPA: ISNCY family transposase [Dehalococcoidia bacterium]|nr:ISNCY family transposase [Dehalococcoidia bacterium]